MKSVLISLYSSFAVFASFLLGILLYGPRTAVSPAPLITKNIEMVATTSLLVVQQEQSTKPIATTSSNVAIKAPIKKVLPQVTKPVAITPTTDTHIDTMTDTVRSSSYKNPCLETVTYGLGKFDERFGISKDALLSTLERSVTTWNTAGQKIFFRVATSSPDIRVDLIYDERQENTVSNNFLKAEIDNSKQNAEGIRNEYEAMKVSFTTKKTTYLNDSEVFTQQQKQYNDIVAEWNAKGGAPLEEYNRLKDEQTRLTAEGERLQKIYEELTTEQKLINEKIDRYNELVRYINTKITELNSTAKKEFTEGNYNGLTNTITVFQYSTPVKLERMLTHEFGHALGIDHLSNENAIMYYLNSSNSLTLSSDDTQALKAVCKIP